MSAEFSVTVCDSCGYVAFPPRLVCRRCGSLEWHDSAEREGVLEQATIVRRKLAANLEDAPPRIGLVSTPRGLRVVVGLDEEIEPGTRVSLSSRNGGVFAARAGDHDHGGGSAR